MRGYIKNIEALAISNDNFRHVLYTAEHSQLVIMSLKPGEDIGMEVHKVDQFFRIEEGHGSAVIDGTTTPIGEGVCVLVPAGAQHNIINTGLTPMKLYTLYTPPNHRDGVIHRSRDEAQRDREHFDGKTTEARHLARVK